jgi:iron(III) transport system ATP-binding protein
LGIRFEDVTHAYVKGIDVVRDAHFRVMPGEVTCLLGPSGCGKSTLLRLAAGLEVLRRGRITIGNNVVSDADRNCHVAPEHRRTGLMFQDYALFPHLTVFENIAFGVRRADTETRKQLNVMLERWGMAELADSYPHTLSGGQQQRCALLRALAPKPHVLLLDEPFSGLDVVLRAHVREETLGLLKETGVSTVIVTHDPEEAMYMADRIFVMRDGKIVQEGQPAEIYLQPMDRFVVSLFGPVNRLVGRVSNRCVQSPLGEIPAGNLADGTLSEILIRPEGIALCTNGEPGAAARVISARLFGRSSDLDLDIQGVPGQVRALFPGVFLPEGDTKISVRVDPAQTFVYPTDMG